MQCWQALREVLARLEDGRLGAYRLEEAYCLEAYSYRLEAHPYRLEAYPTLEAYSYCLEAYPTLAAYLEDHSVEEED